MRYSPEVTFCADDYVSWACQGTSLGKFRDRLKRRYLCH
jgi:hypothetical protein